MNNFTFKTLNGGVLEMCCEVYENSRNWGHKCKVFYNNSYLGKCYKTYYNRAWESFEFESLLYHTIDKYFNGKGKGFLIEQIKAIAEHKREEVKNWANG